MEYLTTVVVIVALLLIICVRAVVVIPQAHAGIVERLGKYQRTLLPGLSLIIPEVDKVRYKVNLAEQTHSFTSRSLLTKDDEIVTTELLMRFQVVDPVAATYELANYVQGLEELTEKPLEEIVGELDLERALVSGRQISIKLNRVLRDTATQWGVGINEIEVTRIEHSPSTRRQST